MRASSTAFPIRSWDRWLDERQARIFVQALDEDGLAVGQPARPAGRYRSSRPAPDSPAARPTPARKSRSNSRPTTSPWCSRATTNRNAAAYAFTDSQLFVVNVSGGEPRQITTGRNSWSQPRFTPDGRTLLAVLEDAGAERLQRVAPGGVPWPDLTGTTSSPTASIAPWAVSRCPRIRAWCTSRPKTAATKSCISTRLRRRHGADAVRRGEGLDTPISRSRRAPSKLALYANWESASSPGEIALVSPAERQGAGAHQVQRARAPRSSTCRPSSISGSPAAAASASTASWCGRRASTRRRNIRCSWSSTAARTACGATSSSCAGTITCSPRPATCCCSLTTPARPASARNSRAPSRAIRSRDRPTRSTRRRTRPSGNFRSSTAAGSAPAARVTAGTCRTGCRARPRATSAW